MVSICNTKARVISADFSYGYLKCIASAEKEAKGQPVSCQIEVGEYYDLADREDLVELTKELAWIPIGNDYLPREKKP